jgi:hypothetical protein
LYLANYTKWLVSAKFAETIFADLLFQQDFLELAHRAQVLG